MDCKMIFYDGDLERNVTNSFDLEITQREVTKITIEQI